MAQTRVGVLRGGPSSEYDISLLSGASVLKHLPSKYQPVDIIVDKSGKWYIGGIEHPVEHTLKKVDVIFNAMHGEYGEDGKVQQILDSHFIPYTGSGSFSSSLAMNKAMTKNIYKQHGLKTPHHRILKIAPGDNVEDHAIEIFRNFPVPLIIKPVSAGSSVGVYLAKDFQSLVEGLRKSSERFPDLILEEYIAGREATAGVIDNFRNKDHYSLPVIEIRPPEKSDFFDREVKYNGDTQEICPGNFSSEEKQVLEEAALIAHKALGLRHYSRSDFIVSPRRGIFILETNTLPGMTSESLFPKSLKAIGSSYPEFLDHVITLALEPKR